MIPSLHCNTDNGYEPVYGEIYDAECIIVEDEEELFEEDLEEQEGEIIYDIDNEDIVQSEIPILELPGLEDDTVH